MKKELQQLHARPCLRATNNHRAKIRFSEMSICILLFTTNVSSVDNTTTCWLSNTGINKNIHLRALALCPSYKTWFNSNSKPPNFGSTPKHRNQNGFTNTTFASSYGATSRSRIQTRPSLLYLPQTYEPPLPQNNPTPSFRARNPTPPTKASSLTPEMACLHGMSFPPPVRELRRH